MIVVAAPFLVPQQRRPGALAVDLDGLRIERRHDRRRVAAAQPQRGEQTERDRLAVRQVEVGGRLERVRERVTEVEPLPRPAIVRVAQAQRSLVRSRPAHVERAAGEQLRLDPLGLALAPFTLRQRREQRFVDHDPGGPVERTDEVLPLRDVDRRLAADARIDLADERRRHGDPRDAAQVERRGETGGVGQRAAAERDHGAGAVEASAPTRDAPRPAAAWPPRRAAARGSRPAGRRARSAPRRRGCPSPSSR